MTDESDEVLTEVEGSVGLITLNRPKAINSLNQPMIDALSAILTDWTADDAVRAVVLSGAGERGLCAGGDVVSIITAHARTGSRRDASGATSICSTRRSPSSPSRTWR